MSLVFPSQALDLAACLRSTEADLIVVHDLIRRLQTSPTDPIIWSELKYLDAVPDPSRLALLRREVARLEASSLDLARLCVDRILEPVNAEDGSALRVPGAQEVLIRSLGKLGTRSFGSQVTRMLGTSRWQIDKAACEAVWLASDSSAETGLMVYLAGLEQGALNSEVAISQGYAVRALGACGREQSLPLIQEYLRTFRRFPLTASGASPYHQAACLLIDRGYLDDDKLIAIATDNQATPSGRAEALRALADAGRTEHRDAFLTLATDARIPDLQGLAIRALGFANDKQDIVVIRRIYEETLDDGVRAEAAEALGRLNDVAWASRLNRDVRYHYAASKHAGHFVEALERLGKPDAVDVFLEVLDANASILIQQKVIEALGRFRDDERARDVIDHWLNRWMGPNWDMGSQAPPMLALARYAPRILLQRVIHLYKLGVLANSARNSIARWIPWLYENSEVREDPLFAELLERLLLDRYLPARYAAATALTRMSHTECRRIFERLYARQDEWSRACAISTLGYWGTEDAVLESAKFDEELLVRRAADDALETRRRRMFVEGMLDFFRSGDGTNRLTAYYLIQDLGDEETIRSLFRIAGQGGAMAVFAQELIGALAERLDARRSEQFKEEQKLLNERGTVKY